MSKFQYAPITPEQLDAVWQIEKNVNSHPWKRTMIDDLNSRGAMHFAMCQGDALVGYFYAQNIAGEVSLLNIAIAPEFQGQGAGSHLINYLIEQCQNLNIDCIWLEVRESNQKAQHLYLKHGFNEVDRRINYYPTENGREDAILMSYYC